MHCKSKFIYCSVVGLVAHPVKVALQFYPGIFSACCFFSTVRLRRGIASGATLLEWYVLYFSISLVLAHGRESAASQDNSTLC
jgi:hypothetical protein